MIAASILALAMLRHRPMLLPVSGNSVWEEEPMQQKLPGYHPILRFGCWQIIRYKLGITYMMNTPDLIQQGTYQVQNGDYQFHAVMANELENADLSHILQDMDAPTGEELGKAYARSMKDFPGDYSDVTKSLTVTYLVKGIWKTFHLYSLTEGDENREVSVAPEARGLIGLWHAPEPFPEKLDARTRYKIGDLDGLKRFTREAAASEGALLSVMDLRADGTYRMGSTIGGWSREGSVIVLIDGTSRIELQISSDGKLTSHGKAVYVRD